MIMEKISNKVNYFWGFPKCRSWIMFPQKTAEWYSHRA